MCFEKIVTSEFPGFFSNLYKKYFMYSSYADLFVKGGRAGYCWAFQCLNSRNESAARSSVVVADQTLMRCSRKGMKKYVGKIFVVVRMVV